MKHVHDSSSKETRQKGGTERRNKKEQAAENPTSEIVQAAEVDSEEEVTAENPGIGKVCLVPSAAKILP